MTPDLVEERLRSALRDATSAEDGAYLDLDPSLVLGRGRRAVLRRRMAAGASVAAATVVVGLVGWSALGGGAERATTPAGPSRSVGVGTVTAQLTSPAAVEPEGGEVVPPGDRVDVAVDRARGTVRYLRPGDGGPRVVAEGRLPDTDRAATWVTPSEVPGLVVGILPQAASDQALVWGGDAPGSTIATQPLPGTGFQAFAVWHSGTPGRTTFAGLDWTNGQLVFRADGSSVPSRRDGSVVAFVDEAQDLFGMFGDGTVGTKRLSDTGPGGRPVMMLGHQVDGTIMMSTTVLTVLPPRARDVVVTPSPGADLGSTAVLGDGGTTDPTLVIARLTMPQSVGGTGVQGVTWRDADGAAASTTVGF